MSGMDSHWALEARKGLLHDIRSFHMIHENFVTQLGRIEIAGVRFRRSASERWASFRSV